MPGSAWGGGLGGWGDPQKINNKKSKEKCFKKNVKKFFLKKCKKKVGGAGPWGVCYGGCLLWGVSAPWGGVSAPGAVSAPGGVCLRHAPPREQNDRCKNITLATTSLRPVKIVSCICMDN